MKLAQKIDLHSILLKRYPASEYVLMREVSDAAGFQRSRSADFVVMNLWPSRGLSLNGFERKSSRSDWLGELKNPKKAENIFQYCDYFWLITDNETVAKIEEIPETWGWMYVGANGKLFVAKEAPKLSPVTLSRGFLAAMLKRAAAKDDWVLKSSINDLLSGAKEEGRNDTTYQQKNILAENEKLKKLLAEYKEVTGIDLMDAHNNRWRTSAKNIGEAVNLLASNRIKDHIEALSRIQNIAKQLSIQITPVIEKVKEICPPSEQQDGY